MSLANKLFTLNSLPGVGGFFSFQLYLYDKLILLGIHYQFSTDFFNNSSPCLAYSHPPGTARGTDPENAQGD